MPFMQICLNEKATLLKQRKTWTCQSI